MYEVTGSSPVPPTMDFKIIYEDDNLLAIDKPAGIETIEIPDKLGRKVFNAHRLDKDTSGVNLFAKSQKDLIFFQKQFKNREVEKRYLALVVGSIKDSQGRIETLIGRSKRDGTKQKVYLPAEPGSTGKREAITEYKVLERFKNYTLLEVVPRTGRMHQIRCHLAYINHPIVGDKKYGFKNQPKPKDLNRQFLHANYIKIKLLNGEIKELNSELAQDLKLCLENLKKNCLT